MRFILSIYKFTETIMLELNENNSYWIINLIYDIYKFNFILKETRNLKLYIIMLT